MPPMSERSAAHGRDSLLSLRAVSKDFVGPSGPFHALRDVSLEVPAGQLLAVVGRSGSGKSTLLNMVAGIDRPSSGEVWVAGTPVYLLDEDRLAQFRGALVGVVFQFFQLLPTLTILENVILPMDFVKRVPRDERRHRALALLDKVGVADQADKLPAALSGGQQQRVAIARALANDPALIVADEPTGNLDSATADSVLDLFSTLAAEGKTVLLVTHERGIESRVERTIQLDDGRVAHDTDTAQPRRARREGSSFASGMSGVS